MRVLYHIPYPNGLGADRWIYDGWKDGFTSLGHMVHPLQQGDDLERSCLTLKPDLFFSAINILDVRARLPLLHAMRRNGTRVLLWVHWPLERPIDAVRADLLRHEDVADIYFGEREAEQMAPFERDTGKRYHVIPHAASPRLHFPTNAAREYQTDVVYLGANLRKKRWFVRNVLRPLGKRYRVALWGPQWTIADNLWRIASRACKRADMGRLAAHIDRRRISLPPERENALYSSARISLNFHEREDDGSQPHYIVNQRTLKIPACGGFQMCYYVPAIRQYFADGEIVMANIDGQELMHKIEYFLRHEDARREIQQRGTQRALADHMYTNRVELVSRLVANL